MREVSDENENSVGTRGASSRAAICARRTVAVRHAAKVAARSDR